ncbi:MAG: CoA-binding domain protein [Candidatus Parvarchaeum acidophilus ARMAN-5]|uniref:CoA-binding domain protein n=1 Tax=Candidatus Parvarchaeum acidophilus ARMAN-5 TaxID=662762 RepID=D6GVY0_PARA5|nr:MAG: CoA-binding domain protein [Candidatus Parvarchaeum acidophilus ARMAN-5]
MDIKRYFEPQSIAVIGASRDPNKVGSAVLKNLIITFRGEIFPINPFVDELQGLKAFKSVASVKKKIDIAVIAVPAEMVLNILKECEKVKIPLAVILSAGFNEIGGDGTKKEEAIKKFLSKAKIRIIGPNCLGIINTDPNFNATFLDPNSKVIKGNASFISQSGALLSAIVDDASTNDIGFSKIISIGNATDISEADIIEAFKTDEKTKVLALYLEGLNNGSDFLKASMEFSREKPLLILKGGKFKSTSGAVSSHTGSMAGDYKAYELAFERAGAISVDNIDDLFNFMRDAAEMVINSNEVIIVTNAGGAGVVTTDHITKIGLKLAKFNDKTLNELAKALPKEANIHNPVDMVGDATPERYRDTLEILVQQNKPIIILFSPQEMSQPLETAKQIFEVHQRHPNVPFLSVFLGGARVEKARRFILERNMPIYQYPNEAVQMIYGLYSYYSHRGRTFKIISKDKAKYKDFKLTSNTFGIDAKNIFDSIGIKSAKGIKLTSEKDLKKASDFVGYPCVLKIESNLISHKEKVGAVIIGIKNDEELKEAFDKLSKSAKEQSISKPVFGLYEDVNKFGENKVEVLVGAHRDPQFGPMIAIGLGGIFANEINDTTFLLSPISDQDIDELKSSKLGDILQQATSQSVFNELISYLLKLDKFMNANKTVKDLDLNPIVLFNDRLFATDFKIFV